MFINQQMVVCQTIFCRLAILNFRFKKLSNGTRTSDNHSLSVSIKSNLQFLRKAFLLLMPIILCHVVDLVIVAIFNFQTTQVYFVQDWKIPVKFTFKVFSLFRKENMLNFVLKLPSTWVSGSYKRLTVKDYHSIMYRVSGSYKRLTVRDYHSIMYRVSGSYKRLTVRDYHSIMYSLPILRNLL